MGPLKMSGDPPSAVTVQIGVSQGGVPKRAVTQVEVTPVGIVGDSWRYPFHGGKRRAILLITSEGIDYLISQGFPIFHGALGENITTRGLNHHNLRIGQRYRAGEATIELSEIRVPCATLSVYGKDIQATMYDAHVQAGDSSSRRWGLSGFYASVVQSGIVRTSDRISLVQ